MKLNNCLSLSLLLGCVAATFMTEEQRALIHYTAPLTGENSLILEPLNETARTGAIPIGIEEALLLSKSCENDIPTIHILK